MRNLFVIKKPWITEKSTDLKKIGKYVFVVKPDATKNEIRKTIENFYSVKVTNVNITNRPPKQKKFRQRSGKQSGYKKAVVTLKKGDKIADIHAIKR